MSQAKRTHIPDFGRAHTLCGKFRDDVACISLSHRAPGDATCSVCLKSEAARARELYAAMGATP